VVVRNGGRATTGFGYQIYVVPRGEQPESKWQVARMYEAYRADSTPGVNLDWTAPNELDVRYFNARFGIPFGPERTDGLIVRLDSASNSH
jgi:hypothetical protein